MWQTQKSFFDTGGNIIQGKISTTLEKYVIKGTAFIFSSEPTFHSYGVVDEGTLTSATSVDLVVGGETNTFTFYEYEYRFPHEWGGEEGNFENR